jgi:hypothetical protein
MVIYMYDILQTRCANDLFCVTSFGRCTKAGLVSLFTFTYSENAKK